MNRLIALGLILALATQLALEAVLGQLLTKIPPGEAFTTLALWSSAIVFVAMVLGGFVARRGFVAPAMLLQLAYFAVVFLILGYIAGSLGGDESLLSAVLQNWRLLLLSMLATLLGSLMGQRLSMLRAQRART